MAGTVRERAPRRQTSLRHGSALGGLAMIRETIETLGPVSALPY